MVNLAAVVYGIFPAAGVAPIALPDAAANTYGAYTQIVATVGAADVYITHIYLSGGGAADTYTFALYTDGTGTTPIWEGGLITRLGAAGINGDTIELPFPILVAAGTELGAEVQGVAGGLGAGAANIRVGYAVL